MLKKWETLPDFMKNDEVRVYYDILKKKKISMRLKRALDLLTYDQRVIITLRFFEDMKIKDIAEITGENINTVKTRLYKALEVLRINIEEA